MDIDVKWERKGGTVIAMLVGRVDSSNAHLLERMLETGFDERDNALILDCEHLSFISSAGLGVSLRFAKKFSDAGKGFAVCALPELIYNTVSIGGFEKVIPVYDTQALAVEALGRAG